MYTQLLEHVEINNLLPSTQSGFRKNHSCTTALSNVRDNIFRKVDNSEVMLLGRAQYHADDTQIFVSCPASSFGQFNGLLNEDLERFRDISLKHHLMLNPNKCVVMIFGPKNAIDMIKNYVKLKIDNEVLEIENNVKSLGIVFEPSMRFSKHISNCIQKA